MGQVIRERKLENRRLKEQKSAAVDDNADDDLLGSNDIFNLKGEFKLKKRLLEQENDDWAFWICWSMRLRTAVSLATLTFVRKWTLLCSKWVLDTMLHSAELSAHLTTIKNLQLSPSCSLTLGTRHNSSSHQLVAFTDRLLPARAGGCDSFIYLFSANYIDLMARLELTRSWNACLANRTVRYPWPISANWNTWNVASKKHFVSTRVSRSSEGNWQKTRRSVSECFHHHTCRWMNHRRIIEERVQSLIGWLEPSIGQSVHEFTGAKGKGHAMLNDHEASWNINEQQDANHWCRRC